MKALVIADEPRLRRAVRRGLERCGQAVVSVAAGEGALEAVAEHSPQIILLDVDTAAMDTWDLCRRLRGDGRLPLIALSANLGDQYRAAARERGADDYVTCPIRIGDLLARMHTALRRRSDGGTPELRQFSTGDLQIDYMRDRVTRAGEPISLTPTEFEVLRCLTLHPDRVLTHDQILAQVWGSHRPVDHHLLRAHVANLRRKLENDPAHPRWLQTEPRVGYRFHLDR